MLAGRTLHARGISNPSHISPTDGSPAPSAWSRAGLSTRRRALSTDSLDVRHGADASDSVQAAGAATRRAATGSLVLGLLTVGMVSTSPFPACAAENPAVTRGLNAYVKKKKLDTIDSYLPPLFLAKEQLIRVIRIAQDPADARQQLRSGSFSGLRENIRSVGEYVSREKGDEKLGKRLVGEFFSELEAADFALLSASRSEDDARAAQVQEARTRLEGTIKALDGLLGELPKDVVERSRSIADVVNSLDAEAAMDAVDSGEVGRLEKLL